MAARRMTKLHQDDVRSKIQTSHLVRRLTMFANGEIDLSANQISAIKILLDKSLASLSATELTGADGGAIQTQALSVKYVEPENASTPGEMVEAPSQTLQ
jgi:hypothetical protein